MSPTQHLHVFRIICRVEMYYFPRQHGLTDGCTDTHCFWSEIKVKTDLDLGFASPCIIIYLNKSTNQMHQSLSFIALSFKYSSTCFGHPHAHHQELNNCSSSLWFTVGTWWQQCCWSWSSRPARPRPTALLPLSSDGKPEAATAVFVAPDDGHEDARNLLSCI